MIGEQLVKSSTCFLRSYLAQVSCKGRGISRGEIFMDGGKDKPLQTAALWEKLDNNGRGEEGDREKGNRELLWQLRDLRVQRSPFEKCWVWLLLDRQKRKGGQIKGVTNLR